MLKQPVDPFAPELLGQKHVYSGLGQKTVYGGLGLHKFVSEATVHRLRKVPPCVD